jgi:gamma-glutamylputrescine oxidase
MTVSIWQANDTQPQREVDVLVVGAGLVGCAAAYFLAQAGRQVVITDMRDVALGASSRNAGFMITGLDTYYHHAVARYGAATVREMWNISKASHAFWRRIAREAGVPMQECGSLLLAESLEEKADLAEAARAAQAAGIDVIYHDHDPLGRGYYAAIEQPWDAAIQPFELTRAVLAASGAELIPNNELYALAADRSDRSGGVLAYTRQAIFQARHVMLCTNAYSVTVDPYFIGKVIPTRAQCLVTEPLPPDQSPVLKTLGYSDYGFMYYRDTFDGRLLIGGGRKQNKPLEHDTLDDRVNAPVQSILDAYLREHFPDVTAPVARRWAGIMAFTPDGLPIVGQLPHLSAVYFCIACNGHGIALGAGTAERAVDLLLTGADPGPVSVQRLR